MPRWITVGLYALATAATTGLGAVPFFFGRTPSKRWLGRSGAVAAGIMLAASFRLITEGYRESLSLVIAGMIGGTAFILLAQRKLDDRESLTIGRLKGAGAIQALLIVGVMTVHSLAEGVGIGVSFCCEPSFGIFVAIAIAVHNIPEGIAISLVLVPKGVRPWKSAFWAVVSSLPQPLVAVPAFLFTEIFEPFLPIGLGLAGGAMIWMVLSEILPDALDSTSKEEVATVGVCAVVAMVTFQVLLR